MSRSSKIEIPAETIHKWQEIVNLLAEMLGVPAALVMRVEPPELKALVVSESEGNPYEPGGRAALDTGLYCETVMKSRQSLHVADALKDEAWKTNPDLKRGMISYLGFPIAWPDGEIFGTICVMDKRENPYSESFRKLLLQFREALEMDLKWLRAKYDSQGSTRMLQAVADGTIDAMFVKDREGRYLFFNEAAARFAGKPASEMIGKDASAIFSEESARIILTRDRRVMETGKAETEEESLVAAGIVRIFLATRAPYRDEEGNIVGVIGVSRDITDHLKNEEALREFSQRAAAAAAVRQLNSQLESRVKKRTAELEAANKELESANKELEAFSYSVSHDLRAPLRHVRSYVEMLQRAAVGRLEGKPLRYLKTIAEASDEMAHLIDDLLAFSKMSRSEMSSHVVYLDQLVREVVRGTEMAAQGRNIVWKIGAMPSVVGDAPMLKQVLRNLIDNAVKYTRPRDPALIEIGCDGEEKGLANFYVRDNGVGFDLQYAGKLFGVFQRLHRPEEFEGTGIGLATVKRILNRHGGDIRVEAAPDRGATFYFTLVTRPQATLIHLEKQ